MITRRQFLYSLLGSAGASILSACTTTDSVVNTPTATSPLWQSTGLDSTRTIDPIPTTTTSDIFTPDVELTLRATATQFEFQKGQLTQVLQYVGHVEKGDKDVLQPIPNSYLGPTIHLKRGQKVRVTLINELPVETIIHWHGQHLPEEMDGHPRYAIDSGETYVYEFEVTNRAGTYWYHPHPHQNTGAQAYFGLAGLLLIHEEKEANYDLPQGEYDLPFVIQDRTFANNNQLQYVNNGHQIMVGYWANTILVNGQLNYQQTIANVPYRLRLLNGSNARIYKLAWHDGTPITVIGTDGGLLAAPEQRDYIMLAPGERLDIWADFSESEGRILQALPFEGANSRVVDILPFIVNRTANSNATLPAQFAPLAFYEATDAINYDNPRLFNFFVNHMTPTIDGQVFEMNKATEQEQVRLNTLEVWEITNDLNQGGFPHPIHIHGVQFQILERSIDRAHRAVWETIREGYVDSGWKDTILLMPGERAKILIKFEDYTGLFLYHCHNLEHEDGGMMRNYQVVA